MQRGQRDELRIEMALGDKVLIIPVFVSTSVANMYTYVVDKEGQHGFELTYKRNTWSECELCVVALVDEYLASAQVHVKLWGGAKRKKKKPKRKKP